MAGRVAVLVALTALLMDAAARGGEAHGWPSGYTLTKNEFAAGCAPCPINGECLDDVPCDGTERPWDWYIYDPAFLASPDEPWTPSCPQSQPWKDCLLVMIPPTEVVKFIPAEEEGDTITCTDCLALALTEYEPADFQIYIGSRLWVKVTPGGDIVCYDKSGEEEMCDCTKMLIAYMAARRD